jgi:pimeloyl-ACP methyl ester carboxylesterase
VRRARSRQGGFVSWITIAIVVAVLVLAASWIVETFRQAPDAPHAVAWAPGADYRFRNIAGMRLRCLRTGLGRRVLLLHTLRTQLDLFRDVVPELAKEVEVHAFDLPGHGYSEIVRGPYTPELFANAVRGYLEALDLTDVVVVGESIGGAIGLKLAAEGNPRIARVVAINSYDYDRGRGIMRGSALSALIFRLSAVPVLGGTIWRFRWRGAFATIIQGSVNRPGSLPQDLVREMHRVGNRPGHYRAFMSLIENFPAWERLRSEYHHIRVPVSLVYGEHDWSRPAERDACRDLIPGARLETVAGSGHLMSLDAPEAVVRHALEAARG